MGSFFSSETPLVERNPHEVFAEYHVFDHALRCRTAYEGATLIKSEQMQWIFNDSELQVVYVDEAEINCIIENRSDIQWITFVGTRNIETHLASYDMEWSDLDATYLHHGFLRLINFTWDKIYNILLQNKSKPVRLTGHSIGAAIACVFALRLVNHDFIVQECITFSQPKVTDEEGIVDAFSKKLKDCKFLRVVNEGDCCVLLPPESVGFDSCLSTRMYKHFGPELKFFKDRNRGIRYVPEHQVEEEQANLFWSQMSWNIQESEQYYGIKGYLSALLIYAPVAVSQQTKTFFRI